IAGDLGLGTDPVRQLSDQPWMPQPTARVPTPVGDGGMESLLRGLASMNSGLSSLMQRRAAERRREEERASLAAGKRAGFDPEFQRQVEAGEVTVADSAAFELGRSLAAAEADGNLFNERLG